MGAGVPLDDLTLVFAVCQRPFESFCGYILYPTITLVGAIFITTLQIRKLRLDSDMVLQLGLEFFSFLLVHICYTE